MGAVVRFALSQADLSPSERLMLIALVTHLNPKTGYATPSMAQLAKDCGITPRGARKVLRELEQRGYLERFSRRMADGRDNTNVYRLFLCAEKPVHGCPQFHPTPACQRITGCNEVAA